MSILISLKNLNLTFGQRSIYKNAELSIHKGERIGMIGLNGHGKSTLYKVLLEEVIPDKTQPAFLYDRSTEPFDIFLVPQELDIENFKHLTIADYYLAFYPELHQLHMQIIEGKNLEKAMARFEELGGWDIQNNYLNYLSSFDLNHHERSIENLSGGEKRKMAISVGLSTKAELVLWDEPTNHLDIETIERFEEELMNCNKTYMIISHDRYLLNHTTDRIVHIENGQITKFTGTYLDYLEHLEAREAELAKNLDKLQNRHRRELAWMRQGIKARGTRSKKRVEGFHNIEAGIRDIKSRAKKVVNLDLQHSGRKSKMLVQIENGTFSYGDTPIFNELNVKLAKKDKIALIGHNGAGKTTLINILAEKLKLTSGKHRNAEDLKVVVFDQHRASLDPNQTPLEAVGDGMDFVIKPNGHKKHVHSYLEDFLFGKDQMNRPISTLSGGERNRLQLAIFMKQAADLWVFDEPTNDLDIETIELLEKELKSYDAAVIIIGHDRAFLDNICRKTWLINDHKLEIFEGGYTQVAPYLHALEMEKELNLKVEIPNREISQPTSVESKPVKVERKTKKMTNPQKERWKKIEAEIAECEAHLDKYSEKLEKFDYTKIDPESQALLKAFTDKRDKAESTLEELYEEYEELSELEP